MSDVKTSRPFRERFLDGYARHDLPQEVMKVKPKRFGALRKKYVTWALGGALALGGMGIPLKYGNLLQNAEARPRLDDRAPGAQPPDAGQIAIDLRTARQIADQVAGGVQGAATTVTQVAVQAPAQIAQTVAQAPQQIAGITEQVKENFFKTQIPFGSIIYEEAKRNDLPPELVAAIAHTESKFIPTARSGAGAVGLMQLVPRTGRWLGARNLTDPAQNIMAGAKYLKYLTDRFDGDQQKAIAAYNAGEGNVRRFGGVPPFNETRTYVERVRSFQQDLHDQLQSHVADVQPGAGPGM
jgi:soluble lytic murein transglycosylase-like protein